MIGACLFKIFLKASLNSLFVSPLNFTILLLSQYSKFLEQNIYMIYLFSCVGGRLYDLFIVLRGGPLIWSIYCLAWGPVNMIYLSSCVGARLYDLFIVLRGGPFIWSIYCLAWGPICMIYLLSCVGARLYDLFVVLRGDPLKLFDFIYGDLIDLSDRWIVRSNSCIKLFNWELSIVILNSPAISIFSCWYRYLLRILLIVPIDSLSLWVDLSIPKRIYLRISWFSSVAIISKSDSTEKLFKRLKGMSSFT